MVRSRSVRLLTLVLSNVLLPIAALVFASGFFPYKPFLPGLATFGDVQEPGFEYPGQPEAVFDRVVFMVVDALRSDFVYGYNSGFEFTQSLIRSGVAIPFTAHATPPTVTMPRVKALTTGSVPSFLDLILNFAESDTTSSLATQDTWLAQIRAKSGKLVFYGDDTWLKLFPVEFFARSDGTSSFFVSDFTEVDNNVTRHVPDELARDDWNAMIMHYLGLDHIGHKTGPQGPNMIPKQREMDGIVKQIYEATESQTHHSNTLLVLAGDHGMNAGGNHGGSGPGETEPALLFASPKFKDMPKRREYQCPTSPEEGTEFHYYSKVEQSDIVATLAGMMGMPISRNSLGVFIDELAGLWSDRETLQLLHQNANQLLHIVRAKYGGESFDGNARAHVDCIKEGICSCQLSNDDERALVTARGDMLYHLEQGIIDKHPEVAEQGFAIFLHDIQEAMSNTASSYHIPRMAVGIGLIAIALSFAMASFPTLWPPTVPSLSFATISLLYGIMMFASSFVEEEQHLWYWLTPAWITILVAKRIFNDHNNTRNQFKSAIAGVLLLSTHRLAVRWNQTGQKHAGEPDIVHTVFPDHHIQMWLLVSAAYLVNMYFLHNHSFSGILMPEPTAFVVLLLALLAIVFKLNFTQADSPELVQGLAIYIRERSAPFGLVMQARGVFALLAVATIAIVVLSINHVRTKTDSGLGAGNIKISLPERLHPVLTLFLMTQTRAPNIPLFLGLEIQRASIRWLLGRDDSAQDTESGTRPSAMEVATTALLFSHVYYFCMGGSNSISSLDLSNAYNGVADYNVAAVGVLLFASNWAGPIWWCSAAILLMSSKAPKPTPKSSIRPEGEKDWVAVEREKLRDEALAPTKPNTPSPKHGSDAQQDSWFVYIVSMTAFVELGLLAVMAACTALRTHLFIWTVFSPKYLYALAWSIGWHLVVNVGFGSLLHWFSSVA